MEKCINRYENRALELIFVSYEFSGDSGASEKHFIFTDFLVNFSDFLTGS